VRCHWQGTCCLRGDYTLAEFCIMPNACLRPTVSFVQVVDKFNDRLISAFVTATHMRLVLLHDGKSEETVRSFFNEVLLQAP